MTGRCLIVANQTLGGDALDASVRECISRDVAVFYVLVPITRVEHETTDWSGGFPLDDGGSIERARALVEANVRRQEESARKREALLEDARRRAQQRLDQMIERIVAMGGQAEGETGSDDPLEATKAVLKRQAPFDEIIVSTLPARLSRWLKMDLPNRIARLTHVPVTTIEAEPD
jgi:hypothetical protein